MKCKTVGTFCWYGSATTVAVFILMPFFWMIITSLKTRGALMAIPVQWIPEDPTLDSYFRVFELIPFARSLANTVFIAVISTAITLTTSSMAAFAFAKIKFRGKEKLFALYLATMMIPVQVTTIPVFIVMSRMNLIDTFTGVILPSLFSAFGVFMLRQHFQTIPDDYIDAAVVDGASRRKIFLSIILPMSSASLAALLVIVLMTVWNDFFWPLIIISSQDKLTLTLALNLLNGQYSTRFNILMAGSLLSMLPIIAVYAAAQKYFQSGLQLGGIKG